jgi:hypothetical protein
MTPEGKVKAKVKKLLQEFKAYYEMPVPGGYGKSGLDFNGCYFGLRYDIECKAPGRELTERQKVTVDKLRASGARVFIIDGSEESLEVLKLWLLLVYRSFQARRNTNSSSLLLPPT